MRRIKEMILAGAVMGGIFLLAGVAGNIETTYKREASVNKVEDGIVWIVDSTEKRWYVEDDGLFEVGDEIVLTIDNHTTDTYTKDDTIAKIQIKDKD